MTDPAVNATAREYATPVEVPFYSSMISMMVTQVSLWQNAPQDAWTYIFEDDVTFNVQAVSNIGGHRKDERAMPSDVQCVLDDAEAAQRSMHLSSQLLLLGLCKPVLPVATFSTPNRKSGNTRTTGGRKDDARLHRGHTLRACTSLCSHAYAVRNASGLFERIRVPSDSEHRHSYIRFSIGGLLRWYYFVRFIGDASSWPRCIDYPEAACRQLSSDPGPRCGGGLFVRNHI